MSHRRRGVGVGRTGATKKYTQKKADELKAISLQSALDTIEKLEVKLTEFATKHSNEIQTDPLFRQRFLEMCAPLGVDPLASKKTFWNSMLGMGDFYHVLAVKVAEVCIATRSKNGGIISIKEIQSILSKRKTRLGMAQASAGSTNIVSASDITIAIEKLGKLGGGFRVVQVGGGSNKSNAMNMVVSVPTELDNDHMTVMAIAADYCGTTTGSSSSGSGITINQICTATSWNSNRTERAIDLLQQQGMVWVDIYKGVSYYWFPSIWQESKE